MLIRFKESFDLPVSEVFSCFETPWDWARLYGLAGEIENRGDGWMAVPLRSFPFPLVARTTEIEPDQMVHWEFRGFWRGEGEVRFSGDAEHVTIEGFERISVRWLGFLSTLVWGAGLWSAVRRWAESLNTFLTRSLCMRERERSRFRHARSGDDGPPANPSVCKAPQRSPRPNRRRLPQQNLPNL